MARSLKECLADIEAASDRFYVYLLFRSTGEPFYVGKGQSRRIAIHELFTKAGRRGQKYSVIRGIWKSGETVGYEIVGFYSSEQDAFAKEIELIATFGRRDNGGLLVNRTNGGEGVSGFTQIVTPEMRAKISAALTGRRKSPEHVAKVAAKRRGHKHSSLVRARISEAVRRPESAAKISEARKNFRHSAETKAKISALKSGLKASAETKAKMSAAGKGRKLSAATREKMSQFALTKRPPMSEETKAKIRAARAKQAPMSEDARARCAAAARAMQTSKRALKA